MYLLTLLSLTAQAHRPSFGDLGMDDPNSAYVIEDIEISIVVYKELTCEQSELWMRYDGLADEELFVQLGVPVIDRLRDHRPSLAVLGPGMPPLDQPVPFDVPEGLGGYVFEAADEPADFYEPFTQTDSWIYVEETLSLVEDGIGYVVGFSPDDLTGKIWVATGTVEDFSGIPPEEFQSWGPIVREFHEVDEYERELGYTEQVCTDAALDTGEGTGNAQGCGCSQVSPGSTGAWALGLLGLAARRRQRS